MLLSIDPGVNNCGLAVVDYGGKFTVLETYNVSNSRRFTDPEKLVEKSFGARVVKVNSIIHHVERLLDAHTAVDHVVIEAPFYSALTPLAYGSLLEVISAVKYRVLIPRGLQFTMAEPLLVKRLFINVKLDKGLKMKSVMRDFLQKKVSAGEIVLLADVQTLTEHEIDAIAVGFSRVISLLEQSQNESR